jgi:hypothetical protein
MEALQSEIIDRRQAQILKSFESDDFKPRPLQPVGGLAVLFLGAGASVARSRETVSVSQPFLQHEFSTLQQQFTTNYDELLVQVLCKTTQNVSRPRGGEQEGSNEPQFRARELEWRRAHPEVLKAFEGEWIVIEGDEVVAHDREFAHVMNQARSRGIRIPYVFFVEPKSEDIVSIGL